VRRDDHVDLAGLQEVLALGRRGLLERDLVGVEAELLGDVARDVDVEPRVRVAGLEPEPGLVELDADGDLVAVVAPAPCEQGAGERDGPECGDDLGAHVLLLVSTVLRWVTAGPSMPEVQWVRIFERKSLARAERGAVKNSSGVASSTIWPSAMKTTRSAAFRAKPISWVTTIIVMPSWAR